MSAIDKDKLLLVVDTISVALILAARLMESAADLRAVFAEMNNGADASPEMDKALAVLDKEIARGLALQAAAKEV